MVEGQAAAVAKERREPALLALDLAPELELGQPPRSVEHVAGDPREVDGIVAPVDAQRVGLGGRRAQQRVVTRREERQLLSRRAGNELVARSRYAPLQVGERQVA